MRLPEPPLLVITDRRQSRKPLEEVVASVFRAGGRWLSLREKDLDPGARKDLLARLVALGHAFGASVMVHEDVEAAVATGAAGVHLPQKMAAAAIRSRLGAEAIIGWSAHSGVDLNGVSGLDYMTLSPIFPTPSKPGYGPALGISAVRAAAARGVPVLALGGVDASTLEACIAAGAAGAAVMGPVMRADDPGAVTAGLLKTLGDSLAAAPRLSHSVAAYRARPSEGGER